jgi:hypothetical protein
MLPCAEEAPAFRCEVLFLFLSTLCFAQMTVDFSEDTVGVR